VIVDEANYTCALGAQVSSLIAERAFEHLEGPIVRVGDAPMCRSRSPRARAGGAAQR